MEIVISLLEKIVPVIITGLFTFFITKYTYNKNKPLDKIEIAYNRVYYPLYKILSDKGINDDINSVIDKSKIYFKKYSKYIDNSTIRLFELLCQCENKTEKKNIYQKFVDHIYNRNSYLRNRLGYLEPSFWQLYNVSSAKAKFIMRILIECCAFYFVLILCSITMNIFNTIFDIFFVIIPGSLLWILCDAIGYLFRFLYYKIRK